MPMIVGITNEEHGLTEDEVSFLGSEWMGLFAMNAGVDKIGRNRDWGNVITVEKAAHRLSIVADGLVTPNPFTVEFVEKMAQAGFTMNCSQMTDREFAAGQAMRHLRKCRLDWTMLDIHELLEFDKGMREFLVCLLNGEDNASLIEMFTGYVPASWWGEPAFKGGPIIDYDNDNYVVTLTKAGEEE
jgi:hypothetical protein